MPQVDLVVLGAEAVVESGGILNMLGSSLIAMTASSFGRPVYVLAESFKFMRCYPLDQRHIPDEFKWSYDHECGSLSPSTLLVLTDGNNCLTHDENNCDFPEMKTAWADVEAQRVPVIEQKMPRVDYTISQMNIYTFMYILVCLFNTNISTVTTTIVDNDSSGSASRLLVLLIDGLRWDVIAGRLESNTNEFGFKRLQKNGAYLQRFTPVFPQNVIRIFTHYSQVYSVYVLYLI
ncbi:translation initiation factor eIF-2B subunit alpha [Schistosoma bovis]|uniref:Translation initiation factor eIF-2B subunit alpha n=1 Tax=Schistosoma bovis TaxID=6184 RepID=A0A430QFI8_SCHBO|nr:translation initiation factor eIF-2B subunit alpha [Schistosoma bovis]